MEFDYIFWFKIWMCIGAVISTPTYMIIAKAYLTKDINQVKPELQVVILGLRYNLRIFKGKVGSHAATLFMWLSTFCLFLKDSLLWPVMLVNLFK
ncbi:hypothetical protein VPHK449_0036 [Vibrio phage K449]